MRNKCRYKVVGRRGNQKICESFWPFSEQAAYLSYSKLDSGGLFYRNRKGFRLIRGEMPSLKELPKSMVDRIIEEKTDA